MAKAIPCSRDARPCVSTSRSPDQLLFAPEREDLQTELEIPENLPVFQANYEEALQEAQQNNHDPLGYQQQVLESASDLERAKRQNLFNATLNASFGLNQQNSSIEGAYRNPMDQRFRNFVIS